MPGAGADGSTRSRPARRPATTPAPFRRCGSSVSRTVWLPRRDPSPRCRACPTPRRAARRRSSGPIGRHGEVAELAGPGDLRVTAAPVDEPQIAIDLTGAEKREQAHAAAGRGEIGVVGAVVEIRWHALGHLRGDAAERQPRPRRTAARRADPVARRGVVRPRPVRSTRSRSAARSAAPLETPPHESCAGRPRRGAPNR